MKLGLIPIFAMVVVCGLAFADSPHECMTGQPSKPTGFTEISAEILLEAAKSNSLVAAYLKQETDDIDIGQLTFIQSPGTSILCTLMARQNSCSMSFRVLTSDGATVMAGAIHYNGQKQKFTIFRILERAPDSRSDFEAFSKIIRVP